MKPQDIQKRDGRGAPSAGNPLLGTPWSFQTFRLVRWFASTVSAALLLLAVSAQAEPESGHERRPAEQNEPSARKEPPNQPGASEHKDVFINPDSPLIAAARTGDVARVKELLGKGASEDARNVNLETPLFAAASLGHLEVVRTLVDAAAGIDIPDRDGRTPLFAAAAAGHRQVVEFLLDNGAKPNMSRNTGETALFMAVENRQIEIVRMLLKMGALPTITNVRGRTPLLVAREQGNKEMVDLLLKANANLGKQPAR